MSLSNRCAFAISFLLLIAPVAHAAQLPPTVLRHVEAYVAAVNEGGEAAADIFRNEHSASAAVEGAPRAAFVGFFANQYRVLGGVELVEARMRDSTTVVALLRTKLYGALAGVTLDLEDAPDRKVASFDPGPAPPWTPAPPRISAAQVGPGVRAMARKGCRAAVFSGAYLVSKGPRVLATGACGEANRRYGVHNTVGTRINLGSMDKMFTAVALMQLVEAGRVSLDDPLDRYLDETWLPAKVSGAITLRHLLTHTSGLGSFLNAEFYKSSPARFRDLTDYKALVKDDKPAFVPGSDYRYSNTGMLLLGAVIERVSGEDYFTYVHDHVFKPAGMTDTGAWPADEPVANVAMGYGRAPTTALGWRENTLRYLYRGGPAGGGFSTVTDLHRFALALQDDKLISRASRSYLWTDRPPHEYGGGFMITQSMAGKVVGHEGFYSGVSSQLEIYVDKGYIVAILGNQDWAAPGLGDAIRGLVAAAD